MFHQSLKIKLVNPLHLVTILWSPAWFTTLELCYHLLKKIAFLPLKKVCCLWIFVPMWSSVHRTHSLETCRQNKAACPTSIRRKSYAARKQPPRICKNNKSKINCESAIGQHLLTYPECAKTYTDDNFRIIGQARSSFHLSVLESVYIKTQNPVLCRQKECFLIGTLQVNNGNRS